MVSPGSSIRSPVCRKKIGVNRRKIIGGFLPLRNTVGGYKGCQNFFTISYKRKDNIGGNPLEGGRKDEVGT